MLILNNVRKAKLEEHGIRGECAENEMLGSDGARTSQVHIFRENLTPTDSKRQY